MLIKMKTKLKHTIMKIPLILTKTFKVYTLQNISLSGLTNYLPPQLTSGRYAPLEFTLRVGSGRNSYSAKETEDFLNLSVVWPVTEI